MDADNVCTFCNKPLRDEVQVQVHEKGLKSLIKKSKDKEDNKWQLWNEKTSVDFHKSCRVRYLASSSKPSTKNKISETVTLGSPPSEAPSTSDAIPDFEFSSMCFICGKRLDRANKKVSSVQNNYVKDVLMDAAERRDDDWGKSVISRLRGISSLVSVRASYHAKCYTGFVVMPREPKTLNEEIEATFAEISNYIEESGKFQFLLSDLKKIMGKNILSNTILFKNLKQKYGDDIYILQHRGREPTIYYKSFNVSKICSDWFCNKESLDDIHKKTILTVAAEILRTEIRKANYQNETYPAPNQFFDDVVSDIPPILTSFLGDLLLSTKSDDLTANFIKRDFIAHAIVSILRPKAFMSTLHLGVGTYIYRKTGSRLIIDLLSKLGACASYHSIQLHEASTIMDPPTTTVEDAFVQFVFDNTDHNVATLTGKETFHCLGGIAVYTPEYAISHVGGSKKCQQMPSASELASQKRIQTIPCGTFNSKAMESVRFVSTKRLELRKPPVLPPCYAGYLLAKFIEIPKFPSWKGFMEASSNDETYQPSYIVCLPFINEPPSNLTTLNTSLHYAAAESQKLGQKTCFVTYDQPLYWKARSIVAQSTAIGGTLKNVVVRLGFFHTQMSYLGSIGYVMDGSGLEALWSVVYAPESVKKMLSGHAYARAVRAHILTFTALGIMICRSMDLSEEWKNSIRSFFENWNSSEAAPIGDYNAEPIFQTFSENFEQKLNLLEANNPTAKLWVQYFRCVTVFLQAMEAQRLGIWQLHLQTIEQMLPLFHAAGHFAYAKSGQIYLQDMVNLDTIMDDDEFRKFTTEGFFTIHRTDKAWSGLSSDIVIEQTLNRFFGTDLRHGRGVTPSVVARYLLGMPSAFNIMEALENYCNLQSTTSKQHVDLSNSRMRSDEDDIKRLLFWLNGHNPFVHRPSLTSLSTGIIGGPNINCHLALEKGLHSMELMVGKNAENISLSNVYKVKNLATARAGIHINDEKFVGVDTYLLFQRISTVFNGDENLTRRALTYELSPFPLSLFDENGFMRKSAKSELYKILPIHIQDNSLLLGSTHVIDGGWLVHQVHWPHGKNYEEIFGIYLSYIQSNFGSNATVVFDGYNNELIGVKSYERYRRQEKSIAADVDISEDKFVTLTQTKFLSNVGNKFKFVDLLSKFLQRHEINTKVANEDADTLIVKTAIELKETAASVTVVGNDVDLLVLLIALTPSRETIYFHKITPKTRKNANVIYSTGNHGNLKKFILFGHAFCGCDTTSAIFKKGKKTIFSILEKNQSLEGIISIFNEPDIPVEQIYAAAEKFIFPLYNAGDEKGLTIGDLRYKIFTSSISVAKKELSLAMLPPTASALQEHSKRVYYQVQQWLGHQLRPEEWGWTRTGQILIPVMSTTEPAPKELLEKVSCGCKTNCSTARCGCKKAGLPCTQLCKSCHGQNCTNVLQELRKDIPSAVEGDESDEEGENMEIAEQYDFDVEESMDVDLDDF